MDNTNPLRSSILGGFNKKDVAAFIEDMGRKNAEDRAETETLRDRCAELEAKLGRLEAQQEEWSMNAARNEMLSRETESLRSRVSALEADKQRLQAALDEAKSSAAAYEAAKERLADMEIESARRNAEIEEAARRKADEIVRQGQNSVSEISFSLENIRRETLRMKDRLRTQMLALETSVEDYSTLTGDKQEFLKRFLPDEPGPRE